MRCLFTSLNRLFVPIYRKINSKSQEMNVKKHISPENIKSVEFDNVSLNDVRQKGFEKGIQNVRNIISELEHSITKSTNYEKELLQCKGTHAHSHDGDWFNTDPEDNLKRSKGNFKSNPSQSLVDLAESWSTMSIVCLQYQYEELTKRYEALLQAYNDKCADVTQREESLKRLRHKVKAMHAQLVRVNNALISVGEKYLALKRRKDVQVCLYEKKIESMKNRLREVVSSMERARLELDGHFSRNMAAEQDCNYALVLAEMRKCNKLFMENLRLKANLEELMPCCIRWND